MERQFHGLSDAEAARRLETYGLNRVSVVRPVRFWAVAAEEVTEPMILLLLGVAVGYFLFGELYEALTLLGIIVVLVLIEVWTEYRAKRAIGTLGQLTEPEAFVVRDGVVRRLPVEQIVPGDVVVLREGSRVPADVRVLRADDLAVDESALTGESVPVEKRVVLVEPGAAAVESAGMVFRGTIVTRGEALAEVTATGLQTELGKAAALAEEARAPRTPLQQLMRELSRVLAAVALTFAILIPLIFVLAAGLGWQEALLQGLSLAFATIPEELPILVTIVLGLGSLRLAREHALVRDLRAAETLGHLTTIVTDKTGTLTENRLRLARWAPADDPRPRAVPPADGQLPDVLRAAYLSLGLTPDDPFPLTDPLERAIWDDLGPAVGPAIDRYGALDRIPFTRERGWSGAIWSAADGTRRLYLKGAPEVVLAGVAVPVAAGGEAPSPSRVETVAGELAAGGYRVLAVAEAPVTGTALPERWRLLGLIALADPLRPEAREAVATVRQAGVRVLIATGDHPAIAAAIARDVGLPAERVITGRELDALSDEDLQKVPESEPVFARISPAHKLRLVRALQTAGEVVGMTGDGINDAPALRAANVGVAMGLHGTDAAREASAVVLTDDRFATLATGVREGRGLFANLQKGVRYYLAVKVGLILAMLVPAVIGVLPPFTPIMIILLELFMDLAASTAFVTERPESDLMARPPRRPDAPFLDAEMRRGIVVGGILLAVTVLLAAWLGARDGGAGSAVYRTSAFTAWMLGHTALALGFRTWRAPLRQVGLFSNRVLNLWAFGALAVALLANFVPWVQTALGTTALPLGHWLLIIVAVLLIPGLGSRLARPRT